MLESMRKHMSWMMWIIVGLVTVTFLFFGIYPSATSGRTVAKVDGYVITSDELNRVYKNMYESYRQVLKEQFDENFAKSIKSQALRELIAHRLLIEEAQRVGLRVSDEELQAYIMRIPAFNIDGKFDKKSYDFYLDRINMTPAMFESSQREYLLRQKLERLVEDGVSVTDAELSAAYASKNLKAKPRDFEKNKAVFRQTYLAEKRREALNAFVKGLQNKASVQINEKVLAL
ncbi:MAG TPA: SurA N-terminal domain-containing protein [Nitrospirota bacterium]|nr:SurA N-terminal domain-containing protein [Nitrospirota bacterium]